MKATIDAGGRIVIPKAIWRALGLTAGQRLEVRATDGRIEIEVAATPMRLERRGAGVVAMAEGTLPRLTGDEVREVLERVRR